MPKRKINTPKKALIKEDYRKLPKEELIKRYLKIKPNLEKKELKDYFTNIYKHLIESTDKNALKHTEKVLEEDILKLKEKKGTKGFGSDLANAKNFIEAMLTGLKNAESVVKPKSKGGKERITYFNEMFSLLEKYKKELDNLGKKEPVQKVKKTAKSKITKSPKEDKQEIKDLLLKQLGLTRKLDEKADQILDNIVNILDNFSNLNKKSINLEKNSLLLGEEIRKLAEVTSFNYEDMINHFEKVFKQNKEITDKLNINSRILLDGFEMLKKEIDKINNKISNLDQHMVVLEGDLINIIKQSFGEVDNKTKTLLYRLIELSQKQDSTKTDLSNEINKVAEELKQHLGGKNNKFALALETSLRRKEKNIVGEIVKEVKLQNRRVERSLSVILTELLKTDLNIDDVERKLVSEIRKIKGISDKEKREIITKITKSNVFENYKLLKNVKKVLRSTVNVILKKIDKESTEMKEGINKLKKGLGKTASKEIAKLDDLLNNLEEHRTLTEPALEKIIDLIEDIKDNYPDKALLGKVISKVLRKIRDIDKKMVPAVEQALINKKIATRKEIDEVKRGLEWLKAEHELTREEIKKLGEKLEEKDKSKDKQKKDEKEDKDKKAKPEEDKEKKESKKEESFLKKAASAAGMTLGIGIPIAILIAILLLLWGISKSPNTGGATRIVSIPVAPVMGEAATTTTSSLFSGSMNPLIIILILLGLFLLFPKK